MISLVKKLSALFVVLLFLSSCYYDNQEELHPSISETVCDTSGTISYIANIVPILKTNCGINNDCHSTATSSSGIALDNYDDVKSNANSILKSVNHDPSITSNRWMPSGGGMLNKCSIQEIQAWVNRGRLND